MQNLYEIESDNGSIKDIKISELRNAYNGKNKNSYETSETSALYDGKQSVSYGSKDTPSYVGKDTASYVSKESGYSCNICNDMNGPFIILSCNHIFHIKCLVEINFKDIYKYPIIDNEYFESRKCLACQETLPTEDLMYLHSKFLSTTKNLISKHQNSIENLENQLKQIKTELRTCYDYKHKLEQEREKSKQIVSVLTTMM